MARPVSLGYMVQMAQQYADQVTASSQTAQQTFINFINASWSRLYAKVWQSYQNDLCIAQTCPIVIDELGLPVALLPGAQIINTALPGGVQTVNWAPGTAYAVGQIVQNGLGAYICAVAGTSSAVAGATGPQGNSNGQLDGIVGTTTLTWNYFPAFFKLSMVQATFGGIWREIGTFDEREIGTTYGGVFLVNGVQALRYRPYGPYKLYILPNPPAAQNIRVFYVPTPPPLALLTDVVDNIHGWDEFVELDAAIQARIKEQNEVTDLVNRRNEAAEEIVQGAPNRDAANPFNMHDLTGSGWGLSGGGYV